MSASASFTRLLIHAQALLAGACLGLVLATPVIAAVDIEPKPLFTTPAVTPALILAVDDSGSMDSEILTKNNDGALWWHTGDKSFTGRNQSDAVEAGVLNFNMNGGANGTWKKFVYLFPNGTGQKSGRRQYSDSSNDHYAVPPIGDFAFARSHEYNLMYFNPATTYKPWPSLGGKTFSDSNPTAAKTDPTRGSETFNLTVDRVNSNNNHKFRVYPGMTLPIGTRKLSGSTCQAELTAPEAVTAVASQALCYFPATFYLKETTPLPAGFGYLTSKTIGGADAVVDGKAPNGSNMIRYEIKPENFDSTAAYDAAIQNFANWFTYYHKRHIATRGAIGQAFKDIYGFRVGSYLINTNPSSTLVYRDMSVDSDRDDFFEMVYEDYLGSGGTPNRRAVNRMWSQLERTDNGAPIQEKCQMNFGVLFTDGYSDVHDTGVGNRDDELGSPFADTYSNTMGDVAARLYLDNPRPDLPTGEVPVPLGCSLATPSPRLDCNTNLHLNLFAITMGSPGTIFNVNQAQTDDPYTNPPTWPSVTTTRNPVQIDDLWHATLNGRGTFLSVDVPSELGEKFSEILAEIGSRLETSSSSAATSSAILSTSTLVYTAGFRSEDWSGTFTAHSVTASEEQGPLVWNAEAKLRNMYAASRKIFTRAADTAGVGSGAVFEWANLTAAQKAALNYNASNISDGLGSDRVDWLRGNESANATFRDRDGKLLGDIVNSDPQYDDGVLYVGANDGMLHAFNGETGDEIFAFIPSELMLSEPGESYAPLSRLTDPNYTHRYMMDGSVSVMTAVLSGTEKKVLVGSMGLGGRSVFALDVTDPTSFSTSNVLWEFRDADLGYGVGQPLIGQFNDGTWVAVFGNGYNSDQNRAFLYVVNLATGALIAKLDTATGDATTPNGLAAPIGTIWPAMNGKAQRIYAGDLLGNLWRFDVSSTPWTVELLFTATDDNGNLQPITSRPAVGKLPDVDNYVVVTFGTGSYFRTSDKTDNHIQSLYGIFDPVGASPNPVNDRSDLLEQEVVYYGVNAFGNYANRVRVLSNHALDTATPEAGWYIDLDEADTGELGERVISDAKVKYSGELVWAEISTLILDEDVCGSGRNGYLMDIDLATGGRTASAVLDLDFNGSFDAGDKVQLADGTWADVSGIHYGQGEEIIAIGSPNQTYELLVPGGDPNGRYARGRKSGTDIGRQGWQQLR
ncbi:PilC domain protein [Thiorhodococcus drewsii AZ1]|uniref:PilC domain protein n=1 Tax=Thiorhodococcus drewsii AZ1 TaxID=765913 RepID=G2E078_9GAMM|nr:PilC/PilY family type IV pilus protein [Thiorhodococcus drewsii]EGV31806.1 PilC domain protein [Thiorhodococcus drewsii AZ1]